VVLSLAKFLRQNLFGKISLAKFLWQNFFGKIVLGKFLWQNFFGKISLAKMSATATVLIHRDLIIYLPWLPWVMQHKEDYFYLCHTAQGS
jgi:hypothetical protein